jgi:hypothetical protein
MTPLTLLEGQLAVETLAEMIARTESDNRKMARWDGRPWKIHAYGQTHRSILILADSIVGASDVSEVLEICCVSPKYISGVFSGVACHFRVEVVRGAPNLFRLYEANTGLEVRSLGFLAASRAES